LLASRLGSNPASSDNEVNNLRHAIPRRGLELADLVAFVICCAVAIASPYVFPTIKVSVSLGTVLAIVVVIGLGAWRSRARAISTK
jgi:hypothetical protein